MSLFGQNSGSSLFGSRAQSNQQKPSNPFASFGSSQPAQQSGLFTAASATTQTQSGGGLFGAASNTQPQQTGGLFGATISQPQQSGGLFGATTSQPQQSGGLFGATASQPQQSTGLFGSTTSQPQPSGGLFGSSTSQPQQNAQSQQPGGLFGSTNQQTGGGLFSAPKPPTINTSFGQNQDQTQKPGVGLFGSVQQSQPSQGTSVFGSLGQNQNQTQQQSSNLFGGASTQNKPTLSLFGTGSSSLNQQPQQQQQQQQPQPSLFSNPSFGAATNTQQTSTFGNITTQQPPQRQNSLFGSSMGIPGTLTLGQGAQNQQQAVPGVRIDVSNLRGTTRFNDLHEELQKQIEQIDAFIQQQIAFKEQCDALMPAHEESLSTIPNDVEFVKTKLETTESVLDSDSSAINTMKTIIQKDAENARIGFRAVENLKLPQQFHYSGIWQPSTSTITPPRGNRNDPSSNPTSVTESADLVSYFNNQAVELSKTLETYKRNISDIETHLGTVEASTVAQSQQLMFRKGPHGGGRSKEEQVRELAAVLREFEAGILGVAGKVGQVREAVVDVIEAGQGGIRTGRW